MEVARLDCAGGTQNHRQTDRVGDARSAAGGCADVSSQSDPISSKCETFARIRICETNTREADVHGADIVVSAISCNAGERESVVCRGSSRAAPVRGLVPAAATA